jgi:FAD:protein FMN transferase
LVAVPQLESRTDHFVGRFAAMASPCEVLMEVRTENQAKHILSVVRKEAQRIESKYSRYRQDNVIAKINCAQGASVVVDEETCKLLDFAHQCYEMSGGLFDITSGVLRRIWKFDGSDRLPSIQDITSLLPFIGWQKAHWNKPDLRLEPGMEIDLGGIGKEYAVDAAVQRVQSLTDASVLVNFGGDIRVSGSRRENKAWSVGIESPQAQDQFTEILQVRTGALATSGDAKRFLIRDGVRYSHVLNPKTGWPVEFAPRAVTVAAATCSEAGILATLALLQGSEAEAFLTAQNVLFCCDRST